MLRRTGRTGRTARRLRRRAAVTVARGSAGLADALAREPRLRGGAAWAAALGLNAVLLLALSWLPSEPLPDAPPGTPIEIVYLDPEPARGEATGEAEPAPTDVEPPAPPLAAPPPEPAPPTPAPVPAPRGPAVDLPDTEATGRPGVVALDCNRVFDDEARATACAGGRVVSGWQAEVENLEADWERLAERVGRARRSLPSAPSLTDPGAAERYEGQAAARRAGFDRANAPPPNMLTGVRDVTADGRDTAGDGAVAPPSILTSYGDRKAAEDEARIREDGRILREIQAAE